MILFSAIIGYFMGATYGLGAFVLFLLIGAIYFMRYDWKKDTDYKSPSGRDKK